LGKLLNKERSGAPLTLDKPSKTQAFTRQHISNKIPERFASRLLHFFSNLCAKFDAMISGEKVI